MQALIELPGIAELERLGGIEEALFRPVCGVPLLPRVIETGVRNQGVSTVLLTHPASISGEWLVSRVKDRLISPVPIEIRKVDDGRSLKPHLPQPFLELRWNVVAGIPISSDETAIVAERALVGRSGKATDGCYSRFNRRLCRSAVRWLSRTRVTPNVVSLCGLLTCVLSAFCFAGGHYSAYVAGGVFFFVAGLFDEMDGMLARITFKESPFGCWLESFADYAGYLLIFSGMTVGLYRQMGALWLVVGGLFVFGCLQTMLVAVFQRRHATSPGKPQEFLPNYYRQLEADSGNWISKRTRQLQFLMKKCSLMHNILIFSILGLLPVAVALGAIGSNLIWILILYYDRRFFRPGARPAFGPLQDSGLKCD